MLDVRGASADNSSNSVYVIEVNGECTMLVNVLLLENRKSSNEGSWGWGLVGEEKEEKKLSENLVISGILYICE